MHSAAHLTMRLRGVSVLALGALSLCGACSSPGSDPDGSSGSGSDSGTGGGGAGGWGGIGCPEFQVSGWIGPDIGDAQAQVAAQAASDFAASAASAVSSLTGACRNIAQDLDADKATQDAAEAEQGRDRMLEWCNAAVSAVKKFKATAKGAMTLDVRPVSCALSVSAKASCQAKCSGAASCDMKANPPACIGGMLVLACEGECTAKAGATLYCEGTCSGGCNGSCATQGAVECAGECVGTCEASASGSGLQADGTCEGVCKGGICDVTAPGATCPGTCVGQCWASCIGTAAVPANCDGNCHADYEPLECIGGELAGGCQAEATCDANCDASVLAKAECPTPEVVIRFSGAVDQQAADKLQAALVANLGAIMAVHAHVKGMAKIAATLSNNMNGVSGIKRACLDEMLTATGDAIDDVNGALQASSSVISSASAM